MSANVHRNSTVTKRTTARTLKNAEPATLVMYLMGVIDDVIADLMLIELYREVMTVPSSYNRYSRSSHQDKFNANYEFKFNAYYKLHACRRTINLALSNFDLFFCS
ncbi:hypothetical protein DPMN_073705 [Dreissena polymorpha]|uniref:Uncharacterized protein n=1 Tax=Dreissena polymorpha TaxID=45954 RepID=A0A9D4BZK4_DREPO|nr:hypothetical protein DPMN_073705 [Dreissena polymorpha]